MEVKTFIKKNFYLIRVLLIVFGTAVFLYAFYFAEKDVSLSEVSYYLTDYRMYLALIFSVLGAFLVGNTLFNKKNVDNILKQ